MTYELANSNSFEIANNFAFSIGETGMIRDLSFTQIVSVEGLIVIDNAFSVDLTDIKFAEYTFSVSDLSIQFDASSEPVLDLEDFAETSFVFVGQTGEIRDVTAEELLAISNGEATIGNFIDIPDAFSVALIDAEFPEYTFDGVGSPDVFLDLTTIENASLGVFSEDGDTLTTFEFDDVGGAFSVYLTDAAFPEYT